MRKEILFICLFLAGCFVPERYTVRSSSLSCAEANRFAYQTLKAMGYTITALEQATPGQKGSVKGFRKTIEGKAEKVVASINCTSSEATVGALEDSSFPDINVTRLFFYTFDTIREKAKASLSVSEGLSLSLLPLTRFDAQLDFGIDLSAEEGLLVKVTLVNHTDRTYLFEPEQIHLRTREGKTQPPLSSSASPVLKEKLLSTRPIRSRQTVTGLLYFPPGDYVSARTILIDQETQEREGFEIQFSRLQRNP